MIIKFIKKHWIFLTILMIGIFLRIYNYKELFLYGHDQDLGAWFVKDVLLSHHLRLIGQETSTEGIFIGPLFYYLLIPFFVLFRMDPIGGIFLVLLIGIFAIWSFYFVFSNIFNKNTGLIASAIYATSFYTVFNDREVVPTMPVILWTVWFLWATYLLLKGKQRAAYLLYGLLLALTWHLNVALVLLTPIIILAQVLSRKRLTLRFAFGGFFTLVVLSLPFFVFELRHGFIQINSLLSAFTTKQSDIISGVDKLVRTILLFSKDIHNLLWGDFSPFGYVFDLVLFAGLFFVIVYKKVISRKMSLVFFAWLFLYILFFSLYSKRLSEYYLNGVIVIFISVFSLFLSGFMNTKKGRFIGVLAVTALAILNMMRFFKMTINRSGYVERQALTMDIKNDSMSHGFPCVSISYITDPGYDRGYRYLLWLNKVKTKPISEKIPVYTIVFPQKTVFKTNKDFGAIGLIYPEYVKYEPGKVAVNCEGDDFNSVDPMIGFTK